MRETVCPITQGQLPLSGARNLLQSGQLPAGDVPSEGQIEAERVTAWRQIKAKPPAIVVWCNRWEQLLSYTYKRLKYLPNTATLLQGRFIA